MITRLVLLSLLCGFAFVASGCSGPVSASVSHVPAPTPVALAPDSVAAQFYDWYIGERVPGRTHNRLSDGTFRKSEYLEPELVEKVDTIIASFDQGGYDPFLCAQDVPMSLQYGRPDIQGDRATVLVKSSFVGHSFSVIFHQTGQGWRIADIQCTPRPLSLAIP